MANLEKLLTELTDCDFKEMLEIKKPKSWLKSVSAFANERGGVLIFGMADDKTMVGLADIKSDIDIIRKQIKEKITPLPAVDFRAYRSDEGKDILFVEIMAGNETPYFYSADGSLIAYIRIGSDSQPALPNRLRELVMKGKNLSFDALPTDYKVDDLSFTIFDAAFKKEVKQILTKNDYISFGLCKPDGILTYAGVMFSDADLLGVPIRVIVSPRNMKENCCEVVTRDKKHNLKVEFADVISSIRKLFDLYTV